MQPYSRDDFDAMSLERLGNLTGLELPELFPFANTASVGGVFLTLLSSRHKLGILTTLYGLGATLLNQSREQNFRDQAWRSYKQDIELSMEWGTAAQGTALPQGTMLSQGNPPEML